MKNHDLQFAVVREDPEIERTVMGARPPDRSLLVASGGCTALSLQSWWPESRFTLVDPNPAQLELVRRKVALIEAGVTRDVRLRCNVESDDPSGLSQCGNFEGLFRGLRGFLHEFVVTPDECANGQAEFE